MSVGPLDGVRVIEVASWMAAPSAGAALADMGAEVVKIEPLKGDPVRGMTRPARLDRTGREIDSSFHADNRGKRSVAVAIDGSEGADLIRRMVGTADVFLCNLLPHRQSRYGLDPGTLLAVRPQLVHATLTGYGVAGPDAGRPGFDVTAFFGRGGLQDAMTEPGGPAAAPRPAQGDHTAGLALISAILAALRLAERSGRGQVVDVSLLGTAAWTLASDLAAVLVDGKPPTKRDRFHQIAPLANRFPCGDGRWIIINMPEPRWWVPFCHGIGAPELLDDERYGTVRRRFENMPDLIAALDAVFARHSLAQWGEIFDAAGLIWGPAATLSELAADPQAHAGGIFPTYVDGGDEFRTIGVPFNIVGGGIHPRGPAPGLGQHTVEELRRLDLDESTISRLHRQGVVGSSSPPEVGS